MNQAMPRLTGYVPHSCNLSPADCLRAWKENQSPVLFCCLQFLINVFDLTHQSLLLFLFYCVPLGRDPAHAPAPGKSFFPKVLTHFCNPQDTDYSPKAGQSTHCPECTRMTALLFCPLAPDTLGISSLHVLYVTQPEKCQEQDGDLPEQLSAETLKAEAMPAGKRLTSAL